jgi:hypothetical protein
MAVSANLRHGLPLKQKELRRVFQGYIHAQRHKKPNGALKSYREMASDLSGMRSYVTLREWVRKDFPKLFEQMRRDHEGEAPGGFHEAPQEDASELLFEEGQAALAALRCAAELLTPIQRGETIAVLKDTLKAFQKLPVDVPSF